MYENDTWFRRRAGAGALFLLFVLAALALLTSPQWMSGRVQAPGLVLLAVDVCF